MRIVLYPAESGSIKWRDMIAAPSSPRPRPALLPSLCNAVRFDSRVVATAPVVLCLSLGPSQVPFHLTVMPPAALRREIKKLSPSLQPFLCPIPHVCTHGSLTSFLICRARPPGTRWRCGCAPSSSRTCSPSAASSRRIPGRSSSSGSSCSSASRWG